MGIANPSVLLLGVGLHQARLGPLHGKVQLLEQMPHMPGMITDVKFLGADLGDQGRSPHAGVQTMGHGATVQDILQMFPLGRAQPSGASTAMAFQ